MIFGICIYYSVALDSSEVFCCTIHTALGISKMAGIPSQAFHHFSFDYKQNVNTFLFCASLTPTPTYFYFFLFG